MKKRLLGMLVAVLLMLSCVSVVYAVEGGAYDVSTAAADDTMQKLDYLIRKFPHGKYWNHMGSSKNNPEGVTDTPCSTHSNCDYYGRCSCNSYNGTIQCMGYANQIAYEITGVDRMQYEESSVLDITKLRVGDIIREGGHSVCVTGVSGNKIAITDCNYGARCIIRWTVVDKSWFTRVEYVLHCKGNNRTNTNINFHDAYKGGNAPTVTPPSYDDDEGTASPAPVPGERREVWQMEPDSSLNIRKSADTSAEVTGSVPAGEKFNVYEKSFDGVYLWAKVEFDGVYGYSVLNYAAYISGQYDKAELTGLKSSYNTRDGIDLSWNEVSGADGYDIYVYNLDGELAEAYESTSAAYTVKNISAGSYLVSVAAKNSLAPSWKIEGQKKAVEVKPVTVKIKGISLRKTGNLEAGMSGTLTPVYAPADTTERAVVWKSSNPAVATVDAYGCVRAVAPGVTVITCTSKQNTKLYASCSFTVKPSSVKTVQTVSGTTENSVSLKWNKSNGAAGYYIYRLNPANGKYVKITATKATSYVDRGLRAGTGYTYVVRPAAVTEAGIINGNYKSIEAKTLPSKITGVRQAGTDTGRVKLTWNKSSGDIYGYVVYRYNAAKKIYDKLAVTQTNSYIAKDSPATVGRYRIVAAVKLGDGYGFSKASDEFKGITGLTAPSVKASSDMSNVKLAWGKVKYATHYQVYRLVNGKKQLVKTVTADTTSLIDKNLKAGTEYTYYIRAARVHTKSLVLYSSQTSVRVKTK